MKQPLEDNGWKVSQQISREEVWTGCLKKKLLDLDMDMPFQPEDHGFILSSVISKFYLLCLA